MDKVLQIRKNDGSAAGDLQLRDEWIELEKGEQAVHDSVVAFLAKQRAGTASTKTRAAVRGGGAKPWRQKGTGRARAGSNRSPIWRGGGIVFGPHPRSHAKSINRRVQLLALKRAFSERLSEGAVVVVEDIVLPEPKTRHMVAFLKAVGAGDDVLLVAEGCPAGVALAARNLPGVELMRAGAVNPYWLLLFKRIVFNRTGFDLFVKRLTTQEETA